MPYCPKCGAWTEGTVCNKCGAELGSLQTTPRGSKFQSDVAYGGELSIRLEKALRRTELLSYAVVGLSLLILFYLLTY